MVGGVRMVLVLALVLGLTQALPSPAVGQVQAEYHRRRSVDRFEQLVEVDKSHNIIQDESLIQTAHSNDTTFGREIPCPKGCHAHGSCNYTSGICNCNPGFHGGDCQTAYVCRDSCNYQGECIADNTCLCAEDFAGEACEIDLRCPDNCHGHGSCMGGGSECWCTEGWTGETCSDPLLPQLPPREWTKLYPPENMEEIGSKPKGRHGHVGSVFGDSNTQLAVIWGGKNGQEVLDDMWYFDTVAHEWEAKAQKGLRPGPRFDTASANSDQSLFMFGGFEPCESTSAYSTDLWEFSFNTETWTRIPMALATGLETGPVGRTGHSMVRIDTGLYVFGGKGPQEVSFSDGWFFSISSRVWSKRASSFFGSRRFHSATAINSNSYLLFGGLDADGTPQAGLFRYTVSDDIWEAVETTGTPPSPRSRHQAVFAGNTLYIFGGETGSGKLQDIFTLDITSNTWSQATANGLPGVSGASLLVFGSNAILLGGLGSSQDAALNVYSIDLATSSASLLNTVGGLPKRRLMPAANVIESLLWIYGGETGSGKKLDDLWSYSMEENTWTLYTPSALAGAIHNSANIFACGGITDSEEGSGSGVVLPETAVQWPLPRSSIASAVTAQGGGLCPNARAWVMFGGAGSDRVFNDLWYWCSDTTQWTEIPVPKTDAVVRPSPRSHAAAALSGATLILFGGMTAEKQRLNDLWECPLQSGACHEVTVTGGKQPHSRRSMHLHVDTRGRTAQYLMFGGYWKEPFACATCGGAVRTPPDRPMDLWRYQSQYTRWRKLGGNDSPEQRFCPATFFNSNRLFMFGGYALDGILEHNDFWYLNVDASQWRRIPASSETSCPPGRHDHMLDIYKDSSNKTHALVYGGIGLKGILEDIWVTQIDDLAEIQDQIAPSLSHKEKQGAHVVHVEI